MFKKILISVLLIGLIGVLAAGALIRTASTSGAKEARGQGYGRGEQAHSYQTDRVGRGRGGGQGQGRAAEHLFDTDPAALNNTLGPAATGTLSEAEIEGVLYMREEEKLAHDAYLALYDKWRLPIFQNIANSEQTHIEAIKTLIDRYGLQDPAAGHTAGVFANTTLQELYNQLIAEGSQSLADALRVGGAIEEIDILDLEKRIAQTDQADIKLVYGNLTQGSQNHLRSFAATFQRQAGQVYEPQYLSQAAYQAIVGSAIERGGRGRRG